MVVGGYNDVKRAFLRCLLLLHHKNIPERHRSRINSRDWTVKYCRYVILLLCFEKTKKCTPCCVWWLVMCGVQPRLNFKSSRTAQQRQIEIFSNTYILTFTIQSKTGSSFFTDELICSIVSLQIHFLHSAALWTDINVSGEQSWDRRLHALVWHVMQMPLSVQTIQVSSSQIEQWHITWPKDSKSLQQLWRQSYSTSSRLTEFSSSYQLTSSHEHKRPQKRWPDCTIFIFNSTDTMVLHEMNKTVVSVGNSNQRGHINYVICEG